MSLKSITVVICALNEEKNIGLLLKDILDQAFDQEFLENFNLKKILIVSDGSTDQTASTVSSFSNKDGRIELMSNEKRIGKIYSLDKAFKAIDSDYAILFDADVRLTPNTLENLATPLLSHTYNLIGGNPIPYKPSGLFNVAEQASYFSWLLVQEIKKRNPNTIYSSHGRILMLSKELYFNLNIKELSTPGDDQYIFLQSKNSFFFAKNAEIFYKMPSTIADYLKQNVRFRLAKDIKKPLIRRVDPFYVPNKMSITLVTFIKNPISGIYWFFLYLTGAIKYSIKSQHSESNSQLWEIISTTK